MAKFTSGIAFTEEGNYLFWVNTKYYNLEDDITCFEMSSAYHTIKNASIESDYKIMRADFIDKYGNGWDIMIDFNNNGKEELRVYKVIEIGT